MPLVFLSPEKGLAILARHVLMPRGVSTPSLRGSGQVPFRPGGYPGPALDVRGFGVDYFDITLEGFVEDVAVIRVVPPFAHPWSVGPQTQHVRVREGRKPNLCDSRDIIQRHSLQPQAIGSCHPE